MGADRAVQDLYETHYRALVQVAGLLTAGTATAEQVVQSAFVAMHRAWRRLGTGDMGLNLRQEVTRLGVAAFAAAAAQEH